jgi:alkylated DNA repair dioxygenase AlkB
MDQTDLFGVDPGTTDGGGYPEGFRYQLELIDPSEEAALLEHVRALPFRSFEFHGYTGNRRVVSFGWKYDFEKRRLEEAGGIPDFLLSLRDGAARFAGLESDRLQQALVSEYDAGAGIGWHRDKAVFGEVVGVSLLAPCTFRLRRKVGDKWQRKSLIAEPRSAYLLSGPARTEWEHSIPPVETIRYSITFRNLKAAGR